MNHEQAIIDAGLVETAVLADRIETLPLSPGDRRVVHQRLAAIIGQHEA